MIDYLYYSVLLFNFTTYGYLLAALVLVLILLKPEKGVLAKIFKVAAVLVVAAHTTALGLRWVQAGFDRPPWTNLYESLIFFTWGLGLVATFVIIKNRAYYLGTFLFPLAFAGLGLASLVPDKSITPLVPALQSNWIKIHVIMATFAYPGFVAAGIASLFYLFKHEKNTARLTAGFSIFALFCLLVVGRSSVFLHSTYFIPVMEQGGDGIFFKIPIDPQAQPIEWQQAVLPGAGVLMLITSFMFALALVYSVVASRLKKEKLQVVSLQIYRLATLSFGVSIAVIYYHIGSRDEFTLQSNTYEMAILVLGWLVGVFYFLHTFNPSRLVAVLPSSDFLDEFTYKLTLFAFPFMTLLLITGAIWAYSAWGRYWGWDPKETCALVTWIIFAAYLHARRYFGTSAVVTSVISIVGAISVFFTFLGANLILSGLHSYGAQ